MLFCDDKPAVQLGNVITVLLASEKTPPPLLKKRIKKMVKSNVPARASGDGHISPASFITCHGSGAPETTIAPRRHFSGLSRMRDSSRHTVLAASSSSAEAVLSVL